MCGTKVEASLESELVSLLRGGLSAVLFLRSGDLSFVAFFLSVGNSDDVDIAIKASLDSNELVEDGNLSEFFDLCLGLFPTRLGLDLCSEVCLLTEWACILFCCSVMSLIG